MGTSGQEWIQPVRLWGGRFQ